VSFVDREGGRGKRLLNCEVKEGVGTKKVCSERKREMVGSGTATDRSKEAVGMMALHEALRTVCLNSDWTYSVFWTIRPRPYVCVCVCVFVYICACYGTLNTVFCGVFSSGCSPFFLQKSERWQWVQGWG